MEDFELTEVAAYVIDLVQNFRGTPQDLLDQVVTQIDNWGQDEYDQALEDYGIDGFGGSGEE